jgi:hypothetical protein
VLNSSSTVFTMDLYKPFLGQGKSEQHLVRVGRSSGFVILLVATLLAIWFTKRKLGVFVLLQDVGDWVAAPIAAVFLLGVLWRFRRPPFARRERLPLGERSWYEKAGGTLCVWRFDSGAVVAHMRAAGLRLVHRRTGEFAQLQRLLRGLPQTAVLLGNNAAYRLRLPAALAATQLLVFEKPGTKENIHPNAKLARRQSEPNQTGA